MFSILKSAQSNKIRYICYDCKLENLSRIYWYLIGRTEDLREDLDIGSEFEDGMLVNKFGESENVGDRGINHRDTYGELDGAQVRLMFFAYIDTLNVKEAEKKIKDYFKATGMLHTCKGHKELFIIKNNKESINQIKTQFEDIAKIYGGRSTELNGRISNLEKEIEFIKLRNTNNIAEITQKYKDKTYALQLENIELKNSIELKDKDIDLLNYKLKESNSRIKSLEKKLLKYKKMEKK